MDKFVKNRSYPSDYFARSAAIENLEVKIDKKGPYKAGQPILVRLTISNPTDSIQTIEFTETHHYHGKLPYPFCVTESIKDSKGKNQCQDLTQYVLWSTIFLKEDLRYISIKPGEKIIRDLKVNEIGATCICSQGNGWTPGIYIVSLSVHGKQTNELRIEVK